MKFLFVILFLLVLSPVLIIAQTNELVVIRNLSALATMDAAVKINQVLDSNHLDVTFERGYRSISLLIQAKSSFSPVDKIKYFRSGRNMLEQSIQEDVTSIELHYLRFCVQTNIPFFLNYSSNIEEDKRFILLNWNKISDADLKSRIRNYMLRSEYCSDAEKQGFKNG
jgi:hypothetical protein